MSKDISKINIRYIENIDDDITKRVFYNRVIKHKKWVGVAMTVGISKDCAKKIFYRYIKKHGTMLEDDNDV